MSYCYLALAMTFSAMITIGGRLYNNKSKDLANASGLYNMLVPIFASLSWLVIWLFDFSFEVEYRALVHFVIRLDDVSAKTTDRIGNCRREELFKVSRNKQYVKRGEVIVNIRV